MNLALWFGLFQLGLTRLRLVKIVLFLFSGWTGARPMIAKYQTHVWYVKEKHLRMGGPWPGGGIKQKARLTRGIDPRVVNVEAQWWFPEQPAEEPGLHGVWESNANVLTPNNSETLDPVTGGWPLRALLCRVSKAETPGT